jgi:DNA repair and recombination RAD54-like protein
MVNFCNPGLLGPQHRFRKYYELPIVAGREPGAGEEEVALGVERMSELNDIVGEFILRRTNSLLSQHLPPKVSFRELHCHDEGEGV